MPRRLSELDLYVREIKKDLKDNDVRLTMRKSEHLSCGSLGFFTAGDDGLEMEIARGYKDWRLTLIHEYQHFCQYREVNPVLKKWMSHNSNLFAVDDYLTDVRQPSTRELKACLGTIIRVEHNCEKRTINVIRKRKLLSDAGIKKYIMESNCVLVNYAIMRTGILRKLRYKRHYFGAPAGMRAKMRGDKLYSIPELLGAEHVFKDHIEKHYKRLTVK